MIAVLKTSLRILKWIALSALGLVVLILVSWQILPDEPLDAETQRLLDYKPQLPAAENMYFAFLGFSSSPELDAHRVGEQIGAGFAEWCKVKRDIKESFDVSPYLGTQPIKRPDYTAPCRPESKVCLAELRAKQVTLEEWLNRYAAYVARYRALRAYRGYAEPVEAIVAMPLPLWGDVIFVSDLVNAQIAFDMGKPARQDAALRELAAEIAFWKQLSEGADTLIPKMISASVLTHKYRLASELLAAYPDVVSIHKDSVVAITTPIAPGWANMKRAMGGELRFSATMFRDVERNMAVMLDEDSAGSKHAQPMLLKLNAYRENASINAQQRQYDRIGTFLSQPARLIVEKREEFEREAGDVSLSPATVLYNPVGKIMTGMHWASWLDYAFRLNDVIGYSRLVEAQRQLILARGQPAEASKAVLANPSLADPYTERPMAWDASTGELRFAGRGSKLSMAGGARVKVP